MCNSADGPKTMAENPQVQAIFVVIRRTTIGLEQTHRHLTHISAENQKKAECAGKFLEVQGQYLAPITWLAAACQFLTEQAKAVYEGFASEFDYDRKISLPVDVKQIVEGIAEVFGATVVWDNDNWSKFKVIFSDGSEINPPA